MANQEQFDRHDKNKDGKLDRDEIRAWVLPNNQALAMEEAVHLIHETDSNRDGQLSMDEILDKYTLWVGSSGQEDILHEEL